MPRQRDKNKPADAADAHVIIRVKDQSGGEVLFKIKRITPLKNLMDTYCARHSVAKGTYVFMHEGRFIRGRDSPHDLGLENGDVLEAVAHQMGGGNSPVET